MRTSIEPRARGASTTLQTRRTRWTSTYPPARVRQRGVALLTAILLVALGTIIATSLGYETVMTARRGEGDFAFDQSLLAAEAAEALAGYALRQSAQQDPKDVRWGRPGRCPMVRCSSRRA